MQKKRLKFVCKIKKKKNRNTTDSRLQYVEI